MDDDDLMKFGKYKGQQLQDVPADYLLWFADQKWASDHEDLLEYVDSKREQLEQEAKGK